jgi:hypothetical protein
MTTTREYRELALQAEKELDWGQAAFCWACAIEGYPSTGALARRDIAKMTKRRDACRKATTAQLEDARRAGLMDDVNYVGHPIHY